MFVSNILVYIITYKQSYNIFGFQGKVPWMPIVFYDCSVTGDPALSAHERADSCAVKCPDISEKSNDIVILSGL